jgi:hypothetical protein
MEWNKTTTCSCPSQYNIAAPGRECFNPSETHRCMSILAHHFERFGMQASNKKRIYILDSVADAILPQSDFDKLDDASGLLHCQMTWPKTRPMARQNLMETRCIFKKRYDMTWLLLTKSRPLLGCADPPRLWPTRTLLHSPRGQEAPQDVLLPLHAGIEKRCSAIVSRVFFLQSLSWVSRPQMACTMLGDARIAIHSPSATRMV